MVLSVGRSDCHELPSTLDAGDKFDRSCMKMIEGTSDKTVTSYRINITY